MKTRVRYRILDRLRRNTAVVVLAGLFAAMPVAQAQAPPDEDWRTIDTSHFRVTFPEGLEDLARRTATYAERIHGQLAASFLQPPEGPIDILLTDHADTPAGSARVWPSSRVVVSARPPPESLALGYYGDWLETLLAHELAHVFHLDYADRPTRLVRAVFGRVPAPFGFPASMSPSWVIEGIATWFESTLTGTGRLYGTYHDMILRTAVLEGRFEDPGQAAGRSPEWPGGGRPYVYGAAFLDHVDRTYGRAALGEFVEQVARHFSWLRPIDDAGRRSFGSVSRAWETWAEEFETAGESLAKDLAAHGPVTVPETLTRGARRGLFPVVAPDGRSVAYLRADGRSDTRLVRMPTAGGPSRSIARVNGIGRPAFLPDGSLVFAQRDFVDRYRIVSDVYIAGPDGEVRRVTRGARLTAPSPGPDGRWAVAVAWRAASSGLVKVDLDTGTVREITAIAADTHWALPAVSPDGRWVAATRWSGGLQDLVILDMAGRVRHRLTRDRALDIAPAWSPGGDYLVWTSDRTGIPNIIGAAVDPETGIPQPPVMLTNVRTGAAYPSIDPAAEWLYFSGYHADGWEVERTPFLPGDAGPAPVPLPRFRTRDRVDGHPRPAGGGPPAGPSEAARRYSALDTLLPRYWLPAVSYPVTVPRTRVDGLDVPRRRLIGYGIGALTSAYDLVGRHAYAVNVGHHPSGARTTVLAAYDYRGLGNPSFGVRAGQTWSEDGSRVRLLGSPGANPEPQVFYVLERERSFSGSTTLQRRRVRSNLALSLSAGFVDSRQEVLDRDLAPVGGFPLDRPQAMLGELVASMTWSNARSHELQMGGTRGVVLSVHGRKREDLDVPAAYAGIAGLDRSVEDLVAGFRAYWPLPAGNRFAAPVLAFRARAGTARGPRSYRGYFDVGGAASGFPVRGYDDAAQSGSRAWAASVEYRLPLASVNRGIGTWPLHMNRIFGVAYADAGRAWGDRAARGDRSDPLTSVGVEMVADVLALHRPFRLRAGIAAPLSDTEDDPGVYVAFGLAF